MDKCKKCKDKDKTAKKINLISGIEVKWKEDENGNISDESTLIAKYGPVDENITWTARDLKKQKREIIKCVREILETVPTEAEVDDQKNKK